MSRTKFRKSRICSSDNYILSREIYKNYLRDEFLKYNEQLVKDYLMIE